MYSQDTTPKPGDNILDPYADKFIGTWQWQENNNIFRIILKKENVIVPFIENVRADWTIGFHKFIQNGVIIEDSTIYSHTNFKDKKKTINAMTDSNNRNILNGLLQHISKNKSVKFEIEYIDSNHIRLKNLKNKEGVKLRFPGQPAFDWGISIPQGIILTRQ